jgi:hypothetical protein
LAGFGALVRCMMNHCCAIESTLFHVQ